MQFEIIGDVDVNRLFCTGSLTKMMTTFTCLSFLADRFHLNDILDDDSFFDSIAQTPESRALLTLFQKTIGNQFSLRDVCSYYCGLPYTFDVTDAEIELVEAGHPFKHHSILQEDELLERCRHAITMIDPAHSKFHYSEIDIIFLGYFIEKAFSVSMESLYQQYVIQPAGLTQSLFSRVRPSNVYYEDLSPKYDYPSIAFQDHGFFCYSNGFYTTLLEQKKLLEYLFTTAVFKQMTDVKHARAASNTLMNGLTVEIRMSHGDVLYGYEGLSFSGCNIWACSTQQQKGYLTLTNDEDGIYPVIYNLLSANELDKAPAYTQELYRKFLQAKHYEYEDREIPSEFQGQYRRVNINDSTLDTIFTVSPHTITIRNPEMITYDVTYDNGIYRTTCKDKLHGIRVGFKQAKSGNRYMYYDGTLYRNI